MEQNPYQDTNDQNPFFIGIGASAGGLDALNRVFDAFPSGLNAVYIVVQHLSPKHKSMMAELLSKHTPMPVHQIEDGMQPESDTVYLIPPSRNVIIDNGVFRLVSPLKGLNLPIDIFFRSLAVNKGRRAVGIILSGTGSDGSEGVKEIKGNGGLTVAQQEDTAQFDGMPHSAINTGMVDLILPPEKIGDAIAHYMEHPFSREPWVVEEQLKKQQDLISRILSVLQSHSGVDFNYYKETTIIRRLERRLTINQIDKIEDYLTLLQEEPKEAAALYQDLLIGVTGFFRDQPQFDYLERELIPKLFENATENTIRVWSVGCSTGEEPYSIAMLLAAYRDRKQLATEIKVFATDIDGNAIVRAGDGFYPENITADIPPALLQQFFIPMEHGFKISDRLRRLVVFANHNVLRDPPFSRLDMIVCRNMLIYLKPDIQQKVLSTFHFALEDNGLLFLGNSEAVGELQDGFPAVDSKLKFYRCNKSARPAAAAGLQFSRQVHPRITATESILPLPSRSDRQERLFKELCQQIFAEFVPACIIVNEALEIVHVCSDAQRFLRFPAGRSTLNILKIIHPELSTPLNALLHRSRTGDNSPEEQVLMIREQVGNPHTQVRVSVRSFSTDCSGYNYFIIVITEQHSTSETQEIEQLPHEAAQQLELIRDLQYRLQQSQENHQAAMEELETTNEELQSTNEELIASNEELQSTNEELQSVNEELHTVNSEYQKKIEELSDLNNDMRNLLSNVDSAIVFLNTDKRLRLFTPEARRIFNFLEHDIGRPIDHFSHSLELEDLNGLIDTVLDTLAPVTMETLSSRGEQLMLKILPYRTANNAVEGIILSLTDMTALYSFDDAVRRERDLLLRVMENSPTPKTMLDRNGNIIFANKAAERLFKLQHSELQERKYDSPEWTILDQEGNPIPSDRLPFSIIINTASKISDYRHYIQNSEGHKILLSIYGAPVFGKNGKVDGAVFSINRLEP